MTDKFEGMPVNAKRTTLTGGERDGDDHTIDTHHTGDTMLVVGVAVGGKVTFKPTDSGTALERQQVLSVVRWMTITPEDGRYDDLVAEVDARSSGSEPLPFGGTEEIAPEPT